MIKKIQMISNLYISYSRRIKSLLHLWIASEYKRIKKKFMIENKITSIKVLLN